MCRPLLVVALRNATFTCFGKNDGGGAQVHAIASVAAFAEWVGAGFAHTPLTHVAHCPRHLPMAEFCRRWESVVSRFGFSVATQEKFTSYQGRSGPAQFLRAMLMLKTRGQLICLPHAHFLTDYIPGVYGLLRPSPPRPAKARSQCLQIAVHVRRGDVGPLGENSNRYTPDNLLRHHIETVRREAGAQSHVTIVTESPGPGFMKSFEDCEIINHDDPLEALAVLADADILVMAKSSFSFVAALLSNGRVFYSIFWSSPQAAWSVLSSAPSEGV